MSERNLDLLHRCATYVGKFGKGAPQVVRRDFDAEVLCIRFDNFEDRLRGNSPRRHLAVAAHVSKQAADRDVCGGLPASNGQMCPVRYRHTPSPSTFADQVRDDPPLIPLLNMFNVQCGEFRAAQPPAKEKAEHCTVADALQSGQVGKLQKALCLSRREPMPQSDARTLYTLGAGNAACEFWGQEAVIRSL